MGRRGGARLRERFFFFVGRKGRQQRRRCQHTQIFNNSDRKEKLALSHTAWPHHLQQRQLASSTSSGKTWFHKNRANRAYRGVQHKKKESTPLRKRKTPRKTTAVRKLSYPRTYGNRHLGTHQNQRDCQKKKARKRQPAAPLQSIGQPVLARRAQETRPFQLERECLAKPRGLGVKSTAQAFRCRLHLRDIQDHIDRGRGGGMFFALISVMDLSLCGRRAKCVCLCATVVVVW